MADSRVELFKSVSSLFLKATVLYWVTSRFFYYKHGREVNIAADDDLCTDDGVDVRGTVKGHRHGREALRGMVPYNIESRSAVFLFRVLPSTRLEGEARPVSPQRHSFALRTVTFVFLTQRNGLRRQHLLLNL